MKVKELMELLAKFDAEAEVELSGGGCGDHDEAELRVDEEVIWEEEFWVI